MKKLYVLAASCLMTLAAAQSSKLEFKATAGKVKTASTHKAPGVLFSQDSNDENGIVSDVAADDVGVYSADDFQLDADATVTGIDFYGIQSFEDLEDFLIGAEFYLYEDNSGKPAGIPGGAGTALAKKTFSAGDPSLTIGKDESLYTVSIDLQKALDQPLTLSANKKYWVVFAPKIDFDDDFDSYERWNWLASDNANFNKSKLVDPYDLFGAGATNWTNIENLVGDTTLNALAFTIHGEAGTMGTTELYSNLAKVSVYPNPATDVLNIKTLDGKMSVTSQIYDANGRLVLESTGTSINVSQLAKGVYNISIAGQDGNKLMTTKFIKK